MVRSTIPLHATILLCFLIVCIPTSAKTQEQSQWEDLGLYGGQIPSIAVDPQDSLTMYAGSWGGDGMFKTTDGGTTWSNIPAANPSWFRNIEVYDIAVDPNNPSNIWVANGHYIDVSYDYGDTWTTFFFANEENRFCYTVAVDPHDETGDTVYVGTGGPDNTDEYGEIYITTDGGSNWSKMDFIIGDSEWYNFWCISFNPSQAGEVWVANRASFLTPNGRIYMSPDSGYTWYYWTGALWYDEYEAFGYLDEIAVNPSDPLLVYASGGNGIAKNSLGGQADYWYWTSINESCRALCVPPSQPDTLYAGLISTVGISTDRGETWDLTNEAPSEFLTLSPHPTRAERLYAGTLNRGVFISDDAAVSWSELNNGIRANTIYDTDIFPLDSTTILCGTLSGVYLTQSGSSWNLVNSASSEAVIFHPADSSVLYAGFDWKIGKSTDSGASWSYLDIFDDDVSHNVSSLAAAQSDGKTVLYAGISYGSGKKGAVVKSTDTGYLFSELNLSSVLDTTLPVNAVAADPTDPDVVYAGTGSFYAPVAPGGLHKSTDGGLTWNDCPIPDLVVNSIHISPSDPNLIVIGCGGSDATYAGIYKSTDAGASWTESDTGLPKSFSVSDATVDSDDASIMYAALYKGFNDYTSRLGGTYISLDGGGYWTQIGLSDYRLYDISSSSGTYTTQALKSSGVGAASLSFPSGTVTAGTASGLYMSSTAGTGVITGSVYCPSTDTLIDDAVVSTSTGSSSISVDGYFMLLVPAGVHSLFVTVPGYTLLSVPSVTVGAGMSVEHSLEVVESENNGDTVCLATALLPPGRRSQRIPVLRAFRDKILSKTAFGGFLADTYYTLGTDIIPVLLSHPALLHRAADLARSSVTVASMMLGGMQPGIHTHLDSASRLLTDIEAVSPPALKKRLNDFRCAMKKASWENLYR